MKKLIVLASLLLATAFTVAQTSQLMGLCPVPAEQSSAST